MVTRRKKNSSGNSRAIIGFMQQPLDAADAVRDHMDATEYKHFVHVLIELFAP